MEVLSPLMNISSRSNVESRPQEGGSRSSDSSTDFASSLGAKTENLGSHPGLVKRSPEIPEPSVGYSNQQPPQRAVALSPVEQRVENTEDKIGNAALDQRVDDLSQRQSIMNFIKKMQQELGVSAGEIVAAFATLTPQELMQPPQQSVDKLIQALPLAEGDKALAKQFFLEMVGGSKKPSVGEFLKASDRQISLQVMSEKEVKRAELHQSVDQMQRNFFAGPKDRQPVHSESIAEEVVRPSSIVQNGRSMVGKEDTSLEAGIEMTPEMWERLEPQGAQGRATRPMTATQPLQLNPSDLHGEVQQAQHVTQKTQGVMAYGLSAPKKGAVVDDQAMRSLAQQSNSGTLGLGEDLEMYPEQLTRLENQSISEPLSSISQTVPAESLLNEDSTAQDQGHQSESQDQMMGLMSERTSEPRLTSEVRPTFTIATQPNPEQSAANIRDLVQNASMLAKDGGGEMKVQMNPEGMGQVSLKVAIEGGSVQVEMVTESDEVKKLLEKGLSDLKSSLATQNLKVDGIRIDTASDVSRQLAERHDESQKQFAQQFMENFRQENNEWRRGFYDLGGPRMVGSQREAAESQTDQVVSRSAKRSTGSRRLDLVA